jgi:hypothetical protein
MPVSMLDQGLGDLFQWRRELRLASSWCFVAAWLR